MSVSSRLSSSTNPLSKMPERGRAECGSALPLMVVAILLAGVLALQIARLGGAAAARARARTAADAAALAGAADGRAAAKALAEANAAKLVRYQQEGMDTEVEVELGGARAVGRATRAGPTAPEP
ncbi:MAG: pilus assembly protein TadG-related protein [Acidimicrobiales bacterium]